MTRNNDFPSDRAPRFRPVGDGATLRPTTWRVLWRGKDIELTDEVVTLGRSTTCSIQIDRPTVSRVHARFYVTPTSLVAEDLHSSNGLFVNGERIRSTRQLEHGDRVLLGTEEILIASSNDDDQMDSAMGIPATEPDAGARQSEPSSEVEGPSQWRREPPSKDLSTLTTQKADAFETLGRLADRMIAVGRYDAATRILSGHMRGLLSALRSHEPVPDDVVASSIRYALKLAEAQDRGSWVDYVVEMHMVTQRLLARDTVQRIANVLSRKVIIDHDLLDRYKQMVRQQVGSDGEADGATAAAILKLKAVSDREKGR